MKTKKLTLSTETIRALTANELDGVAGGAGIGNTSRIIGCTSDGRMCDALSKMIACTDQMRSRMHACPQK